MAKKSDKGHAGVPVGEFVEEYLIKPTVDEDGVQVGSAIGRDGREYPDPVPMSPPVGFEQPPDLMTMIRMMVHHEKFQEIADREGFDTFEEAGDYDVEDDPPDPLTPHERLFFPPDERGEKPPAAPVPSVAPPVPRQAVTEGPVASPAPGNTEAPKSSTST